MAKLPPKSPTHHQNWPNSFPNYHPIPMHQQPSNATPPPFWVDEFLDFSSSRRNSHRRSVSDPIAFAEVDHDCRDDSNGPTNLMPCNNSNTNVGFERSDDEQLSCMFSDEVPPTIPSPSKPSTLSDQSSENDEKTMKPKKEPGEVESEHQTEKQSGPPSGKDSGGTVIVDPKRIKRILANRKSAQRSRVRKLQYISELERSVTSLKGEVSSLSPRVAFLDHQRLILNVDNSALKQRIAALAQDKLFKDAHQEALKKKLERLRKIYHEQSLKKMDKDNVSTNTPPPAATTDDHHQ